MILALVEVGRNIKNVVEKINLKGEYIYGI